MRASLLVPLLAAAALLAGTGAVPAQPVPAAEPKITLGVRAVPLREALQIVAGTGQLSFILSQESGSVPITLNLRDVSPLSALRTLVKLASAQVPGLTVSRSGNLYTIFRRLDEADPDFVPLPPVVVAPGPAEPRVTATLIDVPIGDALRQLSTGSGLRFKMTPERPAAPITLHARDVPLGAVIRSLPRVLPGATVSVTDGLYDIRVPGPALQVQLPRRPDAEGVVPAGAGRKITLTTQEAPLRTVIDKVFAGSGLQYAVDAAVPDIPLTMNVKDVALESVLRSIVKLVSAQEPRLVYERVGDVRVFRLMGVKE